MKVFGKTQIYHAAFILRKPGEAELDVTMPDGSLLLILFKLDVNYPDRNVTEVSWSSTPLGFELTVSNFNQNYGGAMPSCQKFGTWKNRDLFFDIFTTAQTPTGAVLCNFTVLMGDE